MLSQKHSTSRNQYRSTTTAHSSRFTDLKKQWRQARGAVRYILFTGLFRLFVLIEKGLELQFEGL